MNAPLNLEASPTLEQRIRDALGYAWAIHTEPVRRLAFMLAAAEDRATGTTLMKEIALDEKG